MKTIRRVRVNKSKLARPEALHVKYRLIFFKAFKIEYEFVLSPKQKCVRFDFKRAPGGSPR